jgi:hypothetical protein
MSVGHRSTFSAFENVFVFLISDCPPFFQLLFFVSSNHLTGMTSNSLAPGFSVEWQFSQREQLVFRY